MLIDRQSPKKKKEKTTIDEELETIRKSIENQFTMILPDADLEHLDISTDQDQQIQIQLEFRTSKDSKTIKNYLQARQSIMQKYFHKKIILKTKIDYISEREFD